MGAEKTWSGGVSCATGAVEVCQFRGAVSVLVRGTVKSLK